MKITEIRTYLVNANATRRADRPRGRNWVFCKVLTDAGIHGVGEGSGWPAVVQRGVEEVAPLLIGENPFDIERLWLKVYDVLHGHGLMGTVRDGVVPEQDGYLPLPTLPGLRIDPHEKAIAAHPAYAVDEMTYRLRTPDELRLHRPDPSTRVRGGPGYPSAPTGERPPEAE